MLSPTAVRKNSALSNGLAMPLQIFEVRWRQSRDPCGWINSNLAGGFRAKTICEEHLAIVLKCNQMRVERRVI